MALVRRHWTAAEADEWTREDWMAIVLSPLAYIGLAVGVAMSLLLLPIGFVVFAVTVVIIILMHWIIDPKLKAISKEYETRQKAYLERLERIVKWEE